jgi:hypothetical protein
MSAYTCGLVGSAAEENAISALLLTPEHPYRDVCKVLGHARRQLAQVAS